MKEILISFSDDPIRIQAWIDYLLRRLNRGNVELAMWQERLKELEQQKESERLKAELVRASLNSS